MYLFKVIAVSIKGSLNVGDSLEVSSYTELLYYKRFDSWSVSPTRQYILKIYRKGSLIFTSKILAWTENGLNQAIEIVDLLFPEIPADLTFVVSVYAILKGRAVVTDSHISKIVNKTYTSSLKKKDRSRSYRLRAKLPKGAFAAINASASRSRSGFARKSMFTPRPTSGLSVVKQNRPTPVTASIKYVVHTYSTVNPVGTFANTSYQSFNRTYSSIRTPGFKSKAKAGTLPMNPYSMLIQRAYGGALTIHKVLPPPPINSGNFSHTDSNAMAYVSFADLPVNHLSLDENRLIGRLASRIQNGDANIPEDVIQARQTIRLFTNNVNRLKSFGKLKNGGSLSDVLRSLGAPGSKQAYKTYGALRRNGVYGSRALSQMWLELRYGWLPLVNDIEASIKAYSQYLTRNNGVTSVRATLKKIADTETPVTGITGDGSRNGTKYRHTTTACRFGLNYQVDSKVIALFAQLGFTSPIGLAWELVPFSFVVDWFLPIGAALRVNSTFDGLVFKSGFKTYLTKEYLTVNLSGGTDPPYAVVNIDGMAFLDGVRMTRTTLTGFPKPSWPKLKNPVSTIHAANAVALLVQAFTSK